MGCAPKGGIITVVTNVLSTQHTDCVRIVKRFPLTIGGVITAQRMRLITVNINASTTDIMLTSVTYVEKVTSHCGFVRGVTEYRIVIAVTNVHIMQPMICVRTVTTLQMTIGSAISALSLIITTVSTGVHAIEIRLVSVKAVRQVK